MKTRIISILCTLSLLFCVSFTLASCKSEEAPVIVNAQISDSGELILIYQDGTQKNLGAIVGKDGADGKDGATIITENGGSIPFASTKGLRSAVSIVCQFQADIQQGGWWPGSGTTTTKDYTTDGSGVIYKIDKDEGDAFILTNYHVVHDASSNTENGICDSIYVFLYGAEVDEKAIPAVYVGGSQYYDIAILRIEDNEVLKNSDACAIDIADSDKVAIGDTAIAIGNPRGTGLSTTQGIVSVDSEYITMTSADGKSEVSFRVMRLDTPINSGNSGGGLFDKDGNLIGLVSVKIIDDGVENIGYAIPTRIAIAVADNIIDNCYGKDNNRVLRPLVGVTVIPTDSKAVYNPETGLIRIVETVSVHEVTEGSLADGVLQAEDVLLSITLKGEKTDITRQYHMIDRMLLARPGDTVTFEILRNGEKTTVSITITEACLTAY